MIPLKHSLVLTTTLLAFVVAGCSKKEQPAKAAPSDGPSATGTASAGAVPANATTPKEGRAVEITGNDTMKFSLTEIKAKPGEALVVTLRNVGTMPKFSMGHNWILLNTTDTTQLEKFAADGQMSPTTDYIPPQHKGMILANTKLLGPKESDSVAFKAPEKPGRYPYLCSFPGHYQVGMKGELVVE